MSIIDNLRSYYALENANDSFGSNPLTNSGTVLFTTDGKKNKAAGPFSTTKRLSVANAMGFSTTSSATYAGWIKLNTMGGYILDNLTTSGGNKRQLLYVSADRFVLYLNATDNAITTGASSITTGTWYHVILTKSGSSYELFLNNVSKGTATESGSSGSTGNIFALGNTADGGSPWAAPVDGYLDEWIIYDRVIDATERALLYNGGTGSFYPFGPSVTQGAATSIALTSATFNAEVTSDNGSTITDRGFVYSTTTLPTVADAKISVAGTVGAYDATATGLAVNTTYYVRAFAINANGTTYSDEISFSTLNVSQYNIQKDISANEGDSYVGQITVTGTTGTITVQLGTTGTATVINAGSGPTAFSGTYSGLEGLIITRSASFDGTIDDIYYAQVPTDTVVDWTQDTVSIITAIDSSVFFKRIEDDVFNSFRFYRYLDLLFKDLDGFVTVTVRDEREDITTEREKIFSVGNTSTGTVSPFQKKRISFLIKPQAVIIGLSNGNKNETFSIAQFLLTGHKKPQKMFSPGKINSVG